MPPISRLVLFVLAIAAASVSRGQGIRLPEFSAITRTSPATVSAPADMAFNFTLTPGTSAVREVILTFRTPTGAAFSLTSLGGNTVSGSVGTDATNGTYTLEYALVADVWGRMLFYWANGTVEARGGTSNAAVASGVAIVPTAHSLNFSALSFEVTGGIAQPQPPRLISFTRRSPAIVGLGEFAEFDYVIQPGTSALRSVRVDLIHAPLSIGRGVSVLLTTSATVGTVRLPITNDLPPQPVQVSGVRIMDEQGRTTLYQGTILQDINYTGQPQPLTHPFNFADYSYGIVGTNGTRPAPSFTSLTRTPASAALTVGATLTYAYTLNLDGVVAQTLVAQIIGPYGLTRSVNLAAPNGTFSLPVETDWVAGSYQLRRFTVTDPNDQGYIVTPATDSFDVSGGVGSAPTITRQPDAQVFTLGLVDLSVNATATGAITCQWYEGLPGDTSRPVPNADRQSLQFSTTTTSTYYVRITANGESVDSTVMRVIVVTPPIITLPVANQSAAVGGTVTFSVEAQSNGPVRYQWLGSAVDPSTATQPNMTLRNVQAAWAGSIRVEVSNLAGTVSSNALLNVRVSDAPLRITEHPQGGITSATGPTVTLRANATGNPPLFYQWQRDGDEVGYYQGFMASGGGTTMPVTPALYPPGSYRLKVTNGFETVYSDPAIVSWATAPLITSQAQSTSVQVGRSAFLSVNVLGDQPINYQWRRNGEAIPGQTSPYLAVGEVTSAYAGSYDVVITNGAGAVTSVPAVLTVTAPPPAAAPPEVTYPPLSRNVTVGDDLFLQVETRGSNLMYSWRRDGRIIGAPSSSQALYLHTLASSDSGYYDVIVSNELGQLVSPKAYVEVSSAATAPVIVKQPKAQVVRVGETLELTALANGAVPMTWQWRFNGQPITDTPVVQWSTTPSLLVTPVSTAHAGIYDAVVTNALGQTSTTAVTVGVENSYPAITAKPQGGARSVNNSFTLAMQATAPTGAVTYEWLRNGTTLGTASASGSRELLFMQPADAGIYTGIAAANGSISRAYAIVGLQSGIKLVGTGNEIGGDIRHSNGNIYDQILLTGPAVTVIPDFRQIMRISFLDLSDDIVQVEMSGPGTLSLVLENYSPAAAPAKYNQPGISYVKGHATLVVTNANQDTHLSVFSVGSITAVNQALFRSDVTYDGVADLAAVAIHSSDGKFGGLRMANASFVASSGVAGIYAPDVTFTGPVYLHDVKAQGTAVPMIVLGAVGTVGITGGSLAQPNQAAVAVSGITRLESMDGVTSFGQPLPRQPVQGRLLQDGMDVTAKITTP